MELNSNVLGHRLKRIRMYLNLTQKQVADEVNLSQAFVSRLENGIDLGTYKFIKFISFYSKYVYIDFLFDDRFDLIFENKTMLEKKRGMNSVILEKTVQIKDEIETQFNECLKNIDKIIELQKYK